jgi:hypothetical protein
MPRELTKASDWFKCNWTRSDPSLAGCPNFCPSPRRKPDVRAGRISGTRSNSWNQSRNPTPSQLGIVRTATSEKLPGTAFSTVVVSSAWKYVGTVLWSGESSIKALRRSAIRSGFVRNSIAA